MMHFLSQQLTNLVVYTYPLIVTLSADPVQVNL